MVTKSKQTPPVMSREESARRMSHNLRRLSPDANMMELSRRSGMGYRMLQYVLKGEREPAARFVYALSHVLNVPMEELFAPVPAAPKKSRG